ncbi:SGNH/GDSL hydrolase family protein [Paenarthrobacter nitroguajacolicus]
MRLRRALPALMLAVAVTASAGCAAEPAPVSQKVQEYYDNNSSLRPSVTGTPTAATPTAAAPAKFVVPTGRATRVLFTGDSLTGGFFATSKAKAFPALVQEAVGEVEVTQAAMAHQTLTTVSRVTDVPADLDLAVVELGTNDVSVPTPIKDFETQYTELLGKIQKTSPKAAIVCVSTWAAGGQAYDDVISKACQSVAGRYVSVADANKNPANHGPAGVETEVGVSDTFHPNDAGHRAIADSILKALGI